MSRTQGRPRRWPDLLIGLLVLLLLGGFAALLLGQRTGNPTVAQAPTPPATTPPPAVIPSAPGTDLGQEEAPAAPPQNTASTPPQTGTPATTAEPATPNPPAASQPNTKTSAPPRTTHTPSTNTAPAGGSTASTAIPVVPAEPIPAAPTSPLPPQVTVPTPPATSAETVTPPPAASIPSVPPRTGGAVATSEARTPLRSDYRISLGTFGSTGEAQSRTRGVKELGYTVYPIDLGSRVVAQIGPFADETTARQALADIQRAYPRAILYPPRNRSLTGNTDSSANSTESVTATPAPTAPKAATSETPAATSTGNTPAPTSQPSTTQPSPTPSPAASAPAPSGPMYLQVGAFNRVESAQTLVGQLREQGYAPTVNAPETEGRKVTVLIGPFSGEALTKAEEKLDANGFDHFRVR